MNDRNEKRKLRKRRSKLVKGTLQRPRVVICKSNLYLTVQVIDDSKGHTLIYCSTNNPNVNIAKNKTWAQQLGETLANQLKKSGIEEIVFDRNGYLYHGKIKAFGDSIRQSSIKF